MSPSWVWDILLITTLATWALTWTLQSGLAPGHLGLALVGLAAVLAFGGVAGSYRRLIRTVFRVALPLAAVATFTAAYGVESAGALALLVLIMFAIYVMLGGLARARKRAL